jgi:predicted dehydrogenase
VTLGVTGTKGVIEMDMFAQESVCTTTRPAESLIRAGGRAATRDWSPPGYARSLPARPVPVTGVDGLRAVEVVEAAYASVAHGQPVTVKRR